MRMKNINKKYSGFTLMEALITIIIVGVLAFIAIPRIVSVTRKIGNQEAVTLLLALYGQQMRYVQENGAFCSDVAQLDVSIPAPKKFQPIAGGAALHGTVNCGANDKAFLASLTSSDGSYTLYVFPDGSISCTPCPSTLCSQMGFDNMSAQVDMCSVPADCASNNCISGVCIN